MFCCWCIPPQELFKVNFDSSILNCDVEINVIVRDSNDDVMFALKHRFLFTSFVDFVEFISMYESLSKAPKTSLSFFGLKLIFFYI